MPNTTFRYTAFALSLLEKALGSNFSVSGIEKLPQQPIMFVANHFTRVETFIVPYLIYKYSNRQVKCLADSSLYQGILGTFLNSAGAISTKDKNRDKKILSDLIMGTCDWMIYPEGSMLKSKEIRNDKGFVGYTPQRVGRVRTGSAVLALKSQIYRSDLIDANKKKDDVVLEKLKKTLGVSYQPELETINTQIVPVNITYYPLRPGANKIKTLVSKLIKNMPKGLAEELEIEGNLLLGAEININFGDPIDLGDYIQKAHNVVTKIPFMKRESKTDLMLNYFRMRLTNDFMSKIYNDVQVNLDHIFSAALGFLKAEEIEIGQLKRIIYLSAIMIKECGKYRLNNSILEKDLFTIFLSEPHEAFDSVFNLARKQGIIQYLGKGRIKIEKDLFGRECDFNAIRIENSLQVIANEFSLLDAANDIVRKNVETADTILQKKVFNEIHRHDLTLFNDDYDRYFDENFSKERSIGSPFFLDASQTKLRSQKEITNETGVLILHGYKSAPKEIDALSHYLNKLGFNIYAARMRGHGTAPINMQDVSWEEDWYFATQRGYAALQNISKKIVIIGFSTGGLLGLLAASRKKYSASKLVGIISINAALKLLDIRARMVPGINIWNDLLKKMKVEKGRFEYVDDIPENPAINYSRNYLKGVEELGDLMDACDKNLSKVTVPVLIIQSDKDPIVNPVSADIIYDKISSKKKELLKMNFTNHVIINGERKEEVFVKIKDFFSKLNLL